MDEANGHQIRQISPSMIQEMALSKIGSGQYLACFPANHPLSTLPNKLQAFMIDKNQKVRKPLSPARSPVPPTISSTVPRDFWAPQIVTYMGREKKPAKMKEREAEYQTQEIFRKAFTSNQVDRRWRAETRREADCGGNPVAAARREVLPMIAVRIRTAVGNAKRATRNLNASG